MKMQCLFLNPTFKPLLMTKMDVGFPCVLKCSRPVPLTEEFYKQSWSWILRHWPNTSLH